MRLAEHEPPGDPHEHDAHLAAGRDNRDGRHRHGEQDRDVREGRQDADDEGVAPVHPHRLAQARGPRDGRGGEQHGLPDGAPEAQDHGRDRERRDGVRVPQRVRRDGAAREQAVGDARPCCAHPLPPAREADDHDARDDDRDAQEDQYGQVFNDQRIGHQVPRFGLLVRGGPGVWTDSKASVAASWNDAQGARAGQNIGPLQRQGKLNAGVFRSRECA